MNPGNELTPNEARKLDKALRFAEHVMSQRDIAHRTNVQQVYNYAWDAICYHTDSFMQATVYAVQGVLPPLK